MVTNDESVMGSATGSNNCSGASGNHCPDGLRKSYCGGSDIDSFGSSIGKVIQSLYIEFFGIFVPGVVEVGTLTGIIGGVFISFAAVLMMISTVVPNEVAYPGLPGLLYTIRDFTKVGFQLTASHSLLFGVIPCVLFFFLSYLVGAIAYRRSPNEPDMYSVIRTVPKDFIEDNEHHSDSSGPKHAVGVQERDAVDVHVIAGVIAKNRQGISKKISEMLKAIAEKIDGTQKKSKIENLKDLYDKGVSLRGAVGRMTLKNIHTFPYPCLRRYFCERHLYELARFVPWCGGFIPRNPELNDPNLLPNNDARTKAYCTKHQINVLKHAIIAFRNNKGLGKAIVDIEKTECHIKSLTGFWHVLNTCFHSMRVACALTWIVFVGGCVLIPGAILLFQDHTCFGLSLFSVIFFLLCGIRGLLFYRDISRETPGKWRSLFAHIISFALFCCCFFLITHIRYTRAEVFWMRECSFIVIVAFTFVLACAFELFRMWKIRIDGLMHDMRKRELVDIFKALHTVECELGSSVFRIGSTLWRFRHEGWIYRMQFCKNCVHWNDSTCQLTWPKVNSQYPGSDLSCEPLASDLNASDQNKKANRTYPYSDEDYDRRFAV